jgi:hypothetical protein
MLSEGIDFLLLWRGGQVLYPLRVQISGVTDIRSAKPDQLTSVSNTYNFD